MRDKNLTAIYYPLVCFATVFSCFFFLFLFSMCRRCALGLTMVLHTAFFAHLSFTLLHKAPVEHNFKERFGPHLQLLRFECLRILIFILVAMKTRKILFLHQNPISADNDWFCGVRFEKWFISHGTRLRIKFSSCIISSTHHDMLLSNGFAACRLHSHNWHNASWITNRSTQSHEEKMSRRHQFLVAIVIERKQTKSIEKSKRITEKSLFCLVFALSFCDD